MKTPQYSTCVRRLLKFLSPHIMLTQSTSRSLPVKLMHNYQLTLPRPYSIFSTVVIPTVGSGTERCHRYPTPVHKCLKLFPSKTNEASNLRGLTIYWIPQTTTSIVCYIAVSLIVAFATLASAFSDETLLDGYKLSEDNCTIEELRGPYACVFSRSSADRLSYEIYFGHCRYLYDIPYSNYWWLVANLAHSTEYKDETKSTWYCSFAWATWSERSMSKAAMDNPLLAKN